LSLVPTTQLRSYHHDSRTAPGRDELPVLDELATLTGQPSPPLADLRSAYRLQEFVVPDTVTSYSPSRTDIPGSQLTGAWQGWRQRDPVTSHAQAWPSSHLDRDLTLGTRRASAATWLLSMAQLRWQKPADGPGALAIVGFGVTCRAI
jgi:hypothetical protein